MVTITVRLAKINNIRTTNVCSVNNWNHISHDIKHDIIYQLQVTQIQTFFFKCEQILETDLNHNVNLRPSR